MFYAQLLRNHAQAIRLWVEMTKTAMPGLSFGTLEAVADSLESVATGLETEDLGGRE